MKIGIDARFVGPEGTGIGKYTEKLIEHLEKIDSTNSYSIFLKESNWNFLKLKSKNFQKVLADVSWYSLEEQIKMPSIYNRQNLDLLHIPHFNVPLLYKGNFVVTIHDLIHQKFTTSDATTRNRLIYKIKKFSYQRVVNYAIKNSIKIITPSKFVKDQIIETFNIDPVKIIVTYEAAEEEYFLNKKQETRNKKQEILYVGNAYPHKNLENLLDAVKILTTNYKPQTIKLTLVCPRGVFSSRLEEEIEKRDLQKSVEIKGYIDPEELAKIFQKASAYVYPSLSEGFGIPGLNAMAAGLPLICSDISVFREVYGDSVLYFDPKNPKDIAGKIKKVFISDKLRKDLIEKGKRKVKNFSWSKMAKETLNIYESV